jgi:hypothetical protein
LAKSDIELDRAPREALARVRNAEVLAAELADARRFISNVYHGQAREAAQRSAQALALMQALAAKSESDGRVRAFAFAIYKSAARRSRRPWPHLRIADRALGRLGSLGQVLLIAGSGLWRWSGDGVGGRIRDMKAMLAYARVRGRAGLRPPSLVDHEWCLSIPGVVESRFSPIVHYLLPGDDQGMAPHPLFDPGYYLQLCAEAGVTVRAMSPLEHFVRRGAAMGLDPHPLFNIAWYVGQRPDVAASGENPLIHYLESGWKEGLSPHPLFDPEWYLAQAPAEARADAPMRHYLMHGWRDGLTPHPLFDGTWYLARNEDVARAGKEPLTHYLTAGAAEGRDPSPWFDAAHYAALRGDHLSPLANPLVDYLAIGAWNVSEARPGFATAAYIASHPESAAAGRTPLEHWARTAGTQE